MKNIKNLRKQKAFIVKEYKRFSFLRAILQKKSAKTNY